MPNLFELFRAQVTWAEPKLRKVECKTKEFILFLLRPCIFGEARVMKKLVKNNVFFNFKANLTEIKAQIEKNENKK